MPKRPSTGVKGLWLKHGKYCYQPPKQPGLPRPKLIHLSTTDFATAVALVDEIKRREYHRQQSEPLADLVEAYLASKKAEGEHKSRITSDTARPGLNRFTAFFKCQAHEITPEKIRAWKASMLAERKLDDDGEPTDQPALSRATVAGYLRYAQSFCSWLAREGRILRSPFTGQKGIFPKSIPTQRERVCTKAQRDQLIIRCQDPSLKAVLFLGFHAGLRRQEILNLRPHWIERDPDDGRPAYIRIQNEAGATGKDLAFHVKDSEPKRVPISTPLATFLDREFGIDDSAPYLIEPQRLPGKNKYRWDWKRRWATYVRSQKLEWVTPHTMRHTWFTLLLSGPADKRPTLFHLERWSGTAVDTIRKHYAHLFDDRDLIDAAN